MSFQIVNVKHPNSPTNTCVFCIFEASDNPANLRIALERYRDQIDDLESEVIPHNNGTITSLTHTLQREEDQNIFERRL